MAVDYRRLWRQIQRTPKSKRWVPNNKTSRPIDVEVVCAHCGHRWITVRVNYKVENCPNCKGDPRGYTWG